MASPHYLSLAGSSDADKDPILMQVMPSRKELRSNKKMTADPQDEKRFMPLLKLVRRYADRAVILCSNECFIHCRFCFRKRLWAKENKKWKISDEEFAKIAGYLRKNSEIKEAILSGGDPLTLADRELRRLISALDNIESIDVIRIGSRVLTANPARLTNKVLDIFSSSRKIWFMSHFNHYLEISSETEKKIRNLNAAGVLILNHTVLLKGINDSPEVLEKLFRKLVALKVKPHYLFHADPVDGNAHFMTGVDRALEIITSLRRKLSSLAMPVFAIDLPGGGGKITLSPDMRRGERHFEDVDGRIVEYF